jgi:hypothetical protein
MYTDTLIPRTMIVVMLNRYSWKTHYKQKRSKIYYCPALIDLTVISFVLNDAALSVVVPFRNLKSLCFTFHTNVLSKRKGFEK